MDLSKLGLVVLNYNSHQMTARCINSILHYYYAAIQTVIVDNHSSDGSFKVLTETFNGYPNVKVIRSDLNGGYSYGNNLGFRYLIENHSTIEYLAVINPDVKIIDGHIFQNLITALETDGSLAGISPLMIVNGYLKPERCAIRLPRYINNFLSSFVLLRKVNPLLYRSFNINPDTVVAYVDVIPGSFLIMKKDVFVSMNLFDENVFLYGEEIITAKKVKNENLRLGLSFKDLYVHDHPVPKSSLIDELRHLKYSIKSHIYFNSVYNNLFWGTLDTSLVMIFLPMRIFELLVIHSYFRNKKC